MNCERWGQVGADAFADGREERFQRVWREEVFGELAIPNAAHVIPATINAVDCFSVCGFMCLP